MRRLTGSRQTSSLDIPIFLGRKIVSLRHRLIHGYDSVDLDILWEILTKDLPPLIVDLESIISAKDV